MYVRTVDRILSQRMLTLTLTKSLTFFLLAVPSGTRDAKCDAKELKLLSLMKRFFTSWTWPCILDFTCCWVFPRYCFFIRRQVARYTTIELRHLPPYGRAFLFLQLQGRFWKSFEMMPQLSLVLRSPWKSSRRLEKRWYDIETRSHLSDGNLDLTSRIVLWIGFRQ